MLWFWQRSGLGILLVVLFHANAGARRLAEPSECVVSRASFGCGSLVGVGNAAVPACCGDGSAGGMDDDSV